MTVAISAGKAVIQHSSITHLNHLLSSISHLCYTRTRQNAEYVEREAPCTAHSRSIHHGLRVVEDRIPSVR